MTDERPDPRLILLTPRGEPSEPVDEREAFYCAVYDAAGDVVTRFTYAIREFFDNLPEALKRADPSWANAAVAAAAVTQGRHFLSALPSKEWDRLVEIMSDGMVARIREELQREDDALPEDRDEAQDRECSDTDS